MLTCPHCHVQQNEEMPWRTKAVRCASCRQAFLCMEATAEPLPRTREEAQAAKRQ
jgi:hypothetical protein